MERFSSSRENPLQKRVSSNLESLTRFLVPMLLNPRLLEAVHHLPRPLIIYASKREDVKRWAEELKQAGFRRYGVMTGESTSKERSELIHNWSEKNIDIVVATSAFGLGIDRGDVRAVIHVCIPETIDRFYQEVGRIGRDGKAAISLTLYTEDDYKIARS